jgi:hypothetical protein
LFGRKTRAEKLKAEARNTSLISGATLAAAYGGMRPILERLLYDDDLRDNIRTLIESARNILDELSDEKPAEVVARLWDDDKLRREVEAAAGAAQEGAKRMRGQKVKSGGGAGRFLLVPALAGVGFLFLHPRTGPEARRIARDALSTFRSAS